jgi:hypothetical protein
MQHRVCKGECMASIAAKYGFADYRDIYEDPANAGLRKKRPNPSLLFPGDRVAIPERKSTVFECDSGKLHEFEVKPRKRLLQLRLEDMSGTPMANVPATLVLGPLEKIETKTDGSGILKQELPLTTRTVTLHAGGIVRQIRIGDLNPMKDADDGGISGVQARLKNLGFFAGIVDGEMDPETEAAIIEFRKSQTQEPGEGLEGVIVALEKAHGV